MHRLLIAFCIAAIIAVVILKFKDEQKKISKIQPGLYVSDWWSATNEALLRRQKISVVICLNENRKTREDEDAYQRLGIRHYHFTIPDHPRAPISLLFAKTFRIIDDELSQGGRVLVHCQAGVSRSVTIAAAYLVKKNNIAAAQAIDEIRQVRPIAWPNHGFRAALNRI